ncbi:MAG: S41 family peptidase, partial [Bacteroidota bacterium]
LSSVLPFLILCNVGCPSLFAQEYAALPTYSAKQLREDLRFVQTNLYEGHVAPFAYTPKDTFDRAFNTISSQLNDRMNELDFLKLLLPIFERLRCSHTGIGHSQTYLSHKVSTWGLPFLPFVVDNRLFVRESAILSNQLETGTEILTINNMKVDSLIRAFKKVVRTDGYAETLKTAYVSTAFTGLFAFWVGEFQEFQIDYINLSGEKQHAIFPAFEYLSTESLPYAVPHGFGKVDTLAVSKNHFFVSGGETVYRSKEVPRTVILDMQAFLPLSNVKKMRKEHLFPYLKYENITHLIIDLRNNGGGSLSNAVNLLQYLLPETFEFKIVRNQKTLTHRKALDFPIKHLLTTTVLRLLPGCLKKT